MSADFEPGWIAHRIIIEEPVAIADGAGGETRTFLPLATVWAAVTPVRAEALAEADRPGGRITHHVTIRWRDDVKAGMRIRHRGRILAIDTVIDPEERRRYLAIAAREETP